MVRRFRYLFCNLRVLMVALVSGVCLLGGVVAQEVEKPKKVAPKAAKRYTTSSPEVLLMVKNGIEYLEKNVHGDTQKRCGSAALAGLAIYKYTGESEHAAYEGIVQSISEAVKDTMASRNYQDCMIDNYSLGISLIFLTEVMPDREKALRDFLLELLYFRMRPYGSWGYMSGMHTRTGDTSMTQYGCLCLWTLQNAGFAIRPAMLDKTADWLLRTQDPGGGFGYQGAICGPDHFNLVKQSDIRLSMTAAAMGSLYICSDALNLSSRAALKKEEDEEDALAELTLVQDEKKPRRISYSATVSRSQFAHAIKAGNEWFQDNFEVEMPGHISYNYYYLYGLERYMSFRELAEHTDNPSPDWYNLGVEWLQQKQKQNGSWSGAEEVVSDTAFAVLFLMRSTKRSIEKAKDFGPGMLISGQGLPKNLDNIQLRRGKVVPKVDLGAAGDLMNALGDPSNEDYEQAIAALSELPPEISKATVSKYTAELKKLLSAPDPEARQAAVRALGKSNNLDNVPVLIQALNDPDPMIALAANDGLKNLSRRLDDFGLTEGFTEPQRDVAVQKWKAWYLSLRPDAVFEAY